MRAIQKATSSELLTKQAMRKRNIYTANTHVCEQLLNIVSSGADTPVVLGNKFM
jgi:hypothetical protein